MTHRELCERGAKFLKRDKNWHFRCQYVLLELCPIGGESPDVFGINSGSNILIEVKVSRADFLSDSKKPYRKEGLGIGQKRYYLCPKNLISVDELPLNWGLLYCDEDDHEKIEVIKMSEYFPIRDFSHESLIMYSVLRRLIKPQILDFRIRSITK